jgi:hypothetical protein
LADSPEANVADFAAAWRRERIVGDKPSELIFAYIGIGVRAGRDETCNRY